MIKNLPIILAELGKIKIGMKGKEITTRGGAKMRLPVKLDHFIITKTERGSDGNFVIDEGMMRIVGREPKELKIMLPFNSIDANFTTALKSYKGKQLFCSGNNEKAQRRQEDGTYKEIVCDYKTCPISLDKKCKATGVLSVILPQNPELGGVYKFRTTSWHAVVKTLSSLYFLQNITKNLTGVRLTMKLLSGVTEVSGKTTNFKYVSLVYKGEDVAMLLESNKINALRSEQTAVSKKLELEYTKVSEAEIIKDDKDEQEEFHPTETIVDGGMVIDKSTGEVIDHVEPTEKPLTGQEPAKLNVSEAASSDQEPKKEKDDLLPGKEAVIGADGRTYAQGNMFAKAKVVEGSQATEPEFPTTPPDNKSIESIPGDFSVIETKVRAPSIPPQAKLPTTFVTVKPDKLTKNEIAMNQRTVIIEICKEKGMPYEIWQNYMQVNKIVFPLKKIDFNDLIKTCNELCIIFDKENQE